MLDVKQNNAWLMVFSTIGLLTMLLVVGQAHAATLASMEPKQIYQKLCSVCHGDQGDGDSRAAGSFNPRPRNFTAPQSATELSRERMIRSVTLGRPGTAMVGHAKKLTTQQIESVVDYIRANFMHLSAEPSSSSMSDEAVASFTPNAKKSISTQPNVAANAPVVADMALPFPLKLKGGVESGRAFFMKNCFTCHGVKGDGNGPRAYFIAPRPRNFTSAESRQSYNRPRLFDAITNGKRGTVMPAWGKVLDQQQIANVAEFVFQAYIKGSYKLDLPESLPDEDKKKAY